MMIRIRSATICDTDTMILSLNDTVQLQELQYTAV